MTQEFDIPDETAGGDSVLNRAANRLDRALSLLEAKIAARALDAEDRSGDLFEDDRARLTADLDAARNRERALEEVAAEASAALGRAAAEVRAALAAGEG